jgi:hypothetical protein
MLDQLAPLQTWGWPAPIRWIARAAGEAQAGLTGAALRRPLARLYLYGPAALGMWAGLDTASICAQLTNTNAEFWGQSSATEAECQAIIERHFESYMVFAGITVYFAALLGGMVVVGRRALGGRDPPIVVVVPKE